MKVIHDREELWLYSDHLKTFDKLPAAVYIVKFDKLRGFYLKEHHDLAVHEEKVYGCHEKKVEKCLNTFKQFTKNLGVILSGSKGIGKSLFAKMLCIEAMKNGYPIIVVDTYTPGIHSFIEEIDQEVVMLFDEFDKTFAPQRDEEGNEKKPPQATMLSLLDGISGGKKLYAVTCNDIRGVNEYLINRPGRFHYHFRFDYPTSVEISQYLKDKIPERYYSEIEKVVAFSHKVNLNYDCLKAIAYELTNGEPFEEAIMDLNIVNTDQEYYNIIAHMTDGSIQRSKRVELDLFQGENGEDEDLWLQNKSGSYTGIGIVFSVSNAVYDFGKGGYVVPGECVKIKHDEEDMPDNEKDYLKSLKVDYLRLIRPNKGKNIHYLL